MHTKMHHHSHLGEYVVLGLLLATGFFSYLKSTGDLAKQMQIGLVIGFAYVVWGYFHHWCMKDLHIKIVIEYVAIALLGLALLWALMFFIL